MSKTLRNVADNFPFLDDQEAEHTLELKMPTPALFEGNRLHCLRCGGIADGHIHLSRAKSGVPKEERHGWPLPAHGEEPSQQGRFLSPSRDDKPHEIEGASRDPLGMTATEDFFGASPGSPRFCPDCGVSLAKTKIGTRFVQCPIWCPRSETSATPAHKLCTLQRDLGMTINILVGLYEGKLRLETYGPASRPSERAGKILGRLVELIVKEQPR